MSRRTVTRFALPGLLAATLAAPSQATDVAPMPRTAAKTIKIEFEFRLFTEEVIEAAPMPHAARPVAVRPPCCAFDCCQELAAAPMPRMLPENAGRREVVRVSPDARELPSGRYLEGHYPQYFAPDPEFPLKRELATPDLATAPHRAVPTCVFEPRMTPTFLRALPDAPCVPAKPANVPPDAFDTLSRTFGEMMNAPPAPATCPTPPTTFVWPASMSVPAQPASAPCPLPATCAKQCVTGTWTRELAGMMYVVKVAPDHITITASSSVELPDGSTHTEGVVITADYHLARDGTTIVGLITSVDAVIEGDLPPAIGDVPPPGDDLAELQKSLVDKPFAFSVRHYGDVMAVGNVRLPAVEGARTVAQALTVLGGRYTSIGDKPLPKPRAAKPPVLRDILPVPLTANPLPVYIPPQTGIVQASGTLLPQPLPPLPRDVSDRLPGVPLLEVAIPPAPPLMPANLNSTPLIPAAEPARPEAAPMPRTAPKPGKKGKKKVTNE
ncbi:unnamed protein product [Gemmataceae bacterium]|nr:unnamed protein product [Gemmataceae bacterium]VTT96727.1 unnamed protein product [Gemmataceae bacterium]